MIFWNTRNNNNYIVGCSYTIRTGSLLHTVGQGTEEGHRGLALDTLRVTGQRQHGKQPTASHRQYKSSTYVSTYSTHNLVRRDVIYICCYQIYYYSDVISTRICNFFYFYYYQLLLLGLGSRCILHFEFFFFLNFF